MVLHLDVQLVRLILTGLDLGDKEVLALSEGLLDHLLKCGCEDGVYLV